MLLLARREGCCCCKRFQLTAVAASAATRRRPAPLRSRQLCGGGGGGGATMVLQASSVDGAAVHAGSAAPPLLQAQAQASTRDAAAAYAAAACKTVVLIRHGEGFHNIGHDRNLDAHLTPRGWAQTAALRRHLAKLVAAAAETAPPLNVELVVVSPLRRTLETAAGVFGRAAPPPNTSNDNGGDDDDSGADGWLLMRPQQGKRNERAAHAAIYRQPAAADSRRPLPMVAEEGCRERIGPNACDRFRPIEQQRASFPGVDFSRVRTADDAAWEELHAARCSDGGAYAVGESEDACEERAIGFWRALMARPERVIAVVSHAGFCHHSCRALARQMLAAWSDAMLAECARRGPAGSTAEAAAGTAASGGCVVELAEAARAGAGAVAKLATADWDNCEARVLELRWGPPLQAAPPGACGEGGGKGGGKDGGGDSDSRQWLWAAPSGDAATLWHPGGACGLNGDA